jgi:hypothetical protein
MNPFNHSPKRNTYNELHLHTKHRFAKKNGQKQAKKSRKNHLKTKNG